jgi:hypothetical protein
MMAKLMSGPTYYAWLELVVAARTDEELRGHVRSVNERFDRDMEALHAEISEGRGGGNLVATQFALATLQGLAVSGIYEDPARLDPVRDLLRKLSGIL